jgi:hypothetical protein
MLSSSVLARRLLRRREDGHTMIQERGGTVFLSDGELSVVDPTDFILGRQRQHRHLHQVRATAGECLQYIRLFDCVGLLQSEY